MVHYVFQAVLQKNNGSIPIVHFLPGGAKSTLVSISYTLPGGAIKSELLRLYYTSAFLEVLTNEQQMYSKFSL